MPYKVIVEKGIIKILSKIDEPYGSAIKKALYALAGDPRPHGYKKLKGRDGYRIKVGPYRIIYDIIDQALVVKIITVGDRKEIYD